MLTPGDLLEHSNKAFQHNVAREVFARTGISRAYYACYHFCLKAANDWCFTLPRDQREKAGYHEQLIRRLKGCGKHEITKADLITLADMLGKARDLRVDADYFLDRPVGELDYRKALVVGRQIQAKVEEITQTIQSSLATALPLVLETRSAPKETK